MNSPFHPARILRQTENSPPYKTTTEASRAAYIRLSAKRVMNRPLITSIFDLSDLVPKLPVHSVLGYELGDLNGVPGGNEIYLHFGRQRLMMIDPSSHLYFVGAYVENRNDDEPAHFGVHFVSNSSDEPMNSIRVWLSPSRSVKDNWLEWKDQQKHWTNSSLLRNHEAITAAMEVTVKSLLYLGTDDADMEIGCGAVDNEPEAGNTTDFPLIYVVGRKTRPIERLDPPIRKENGRRLGF